MTATPEERGAALANVVEDICCSYVGVLYFKSELAARLIARAIRDAEDAALERAAGCVRDNFVNGEGHYAIEAINALKHSKETQA